MWATTFGNRADMFWWTQTSGIEELPEMENNAGYIDGHVERFNESESINASPDQAQRFQIPRNWR